MHKRVGYTELLNSKIRSDKLLAARDTVRRAKLKMFLDQHQRASQWATCIAALVDASRHNVEVTSDMLCGAIDRCGKRGMLDVARRLYTDFHRDMNRPRSKAVHVAYMAACADCGDFKEAHNQYVRLRQRDTAYFSRDVSHVPIVSDDVTAEYLRAAVAASRRSRRTGSVLHNEGKRQGACASVGAVGCHCSGADIARSLNEEESAGRAAPWELALEQFVSLRTGGEGFRDHNALTPVVVERVAWLLDAGGKWEHCLRFLQLCGRQNVLIPPEARDAAISLCYRHGRHVEVLQQMQHMIATRSPPAERSVRLALTSCEEVAAMEQYAAPQQQHEHQAWSLSLTLFNAMRSNGVVMYQQNYESPLRSCTMAGRWEDAVTILQVMKKDNRPTSSQVYRLVLAARIERCNSFEEAQRFTQIPVMQNGGMIVYLALLRCCMNIGDWKNFDRVNREMRDRECPETFDKMRLLIEAAYMRGQWHSVLMRFARFESITGHELQRVKEDKIVRRYDEDFEISDALLDMVLDAYERLKDHKDPVVHVAYRSAVKRKEQGTVQLAFSSASTAATPHKEWMFAHTEEGQSTQNDL